jgi:signal transduction histidine kinase
MQNYNGPIPENELSRLIGLSQLDLNYFKLNDDFKDLTNLAAKVAGTEMSLINIIDSYTQWSISSYGINTGQAPREESICQYTIMSDNPLEISDLSLDERFNSKDYVKKAPGLRYYYGLPLQISKGISIGALCMVDSKVKRLNKEQTELLTLIAESVVMRFKAVKAQNDLKSKLKNCIDANSKVAHDIRGPLSGILGLSELMKSSEVASDAEQVIEYTYMISKSSKSLIELTDNILSSSEKTDDLDNHFDMVLFKDNLDELYTPQAKYKNVNLEIQVKSKNSRLTLAKGKLIQIAGNLISNAIKFTRSGGLIGVDLSFEILEEQSQLKIIVSDNGVGFDAELTTKILTGGNLSTLGTIGEKGFGLGLKLVNELIKSLNGTLKMNSKKGNGAVFEIILPQPCIPIHSG